MICAVNTDSYIMNDMAVVVNVMVLIPGSCVFIYPSFPFVLKRCSAAACSVLPFCDLKRGTVFIPLSCFLQSHNGFTFDKSWCNQSLRCLFIV